jgi:uncharacterized protein YecT (DUF1311 family)
MSMALRLIVLLAAAALTMSSSVRAEDCQNAASQRELNNCANAAYEKSDAELNALYKQVTARLKDDAKQTKLLVAAQRAWIAFRDAECAFVGEPTADGSVNPLVRANCLDRITSARVNDLKSYLQCAEGDVSCPLPPQ